MSKRMTIDASNEAAKREAKAAQTRRMIEKRMAEAKANPPKPLSAAAKKKLQKVRPRIGLALISSDVSDAPFGKIHEGSLCVGVSRLLKGVRDTGSLNMAAKTMGMAYSKAWRILKLVEGNIGAKLIDRYGARGSVLTAEGSKLLDAYLQLQDELSELAERRFAEMLAK